MENNTIFLTIWGLGILPTAYILGRLKITDEIAGFLSFTWPVMICLSPLIGFMYVLSKVNKKGYNNGK